MKNTIYPSLFLFFAFLMSCTNSPNQPNTKTNSDSLQHQQELVNGNRDSISNPKDTLSKNDPKIADIETVKKWKVEDYIIKDKDKSSKEVRSYIQYVIDPWKNVQNPIIASYQGCELGDYFHLNFEDSYGTNYDFGFGDNSFGPYTLYNEADYEDNPKYVGKSFKIYWNWKVTSFPCCDGEYDLVDAYLPAITKLELIEVK